MSGKGLVTDRSRSQAKNPSSASGKRAMRLRQQRRGQGGIFPTVVFRRPRLRSLLSSCVLIVIGGLVGFQFIALSRHNRQYSGSFNSQEHPDASSMEGRGLKFTLNEHRRRRDQHRLKEMQQEEKKIQQQLLQQEQKAQTDVTVRDPPDSDRRRRLNTTQGAANTTANQQQQQQQPRATKRKFKMKRSAKPPPSDFNNRAMPLDPLSPEFDLSQLTPTNYTLRSQWHGVLLDAGRHYFEVDWIKRMLDVLAVLQYSCLHFRLTDDQAFNVRLDSQPALAHPVGILGNNQTYTPAELRDIVAYGKSKGITIWPEINVPGHGGGWAGIPGMIVQCPQFICDKGYGIPINVEHPKFRSVLTDVLREILDIFDNPPFLHLGGDEVDMAMPCFKEVGKAMFNYDIFEKTLQQIIKDLNYPEEQVIRWEMTGQRLKSPRAGKMPQYWFRIPGESAPNMGYNGFFASGGLYFDFNEMDMAWQIYLYTRRYYHLPNNNFPIGIIVGTFELDANFWYDRNVVGRLLAVTMGASQEVDADDGNELNLLYQDACRKVGFEPALCSHYGLPPISWKDYKDKWNGVWTQWKNRICQRLTTHDNVLEYGLPETTQRSRTTRVAPEPSGTARTRFWETFGKPSNVQLIDPGNMQAVAEVKATSGLASLVDHRLVPQTGVILDVTVPGSLPAIATKSQSWLLTQMHQLGFNLLQVRLLNERAFAHKSYVVPHGHNPAESTNLDIGLLNKTVVIEAQKLGIGVIPEIAISTEASGAYKVGYQVKCPQHICDTGFGVQDVNSLDYAAVAYGMVREIESIATAGLIHLGSDEREASLPCFAEVSQAANFDQFEEKLSYLLEYDGLSSDKIIRWSNTEGIEYAGRVGGITQCREGDCRGETTKEWIATVDVQIGGPFEIFSTTRELALRQPKAVLAEVGRIDPDSMSTNHVYMRLLAFAMGTAHNTKDDWSQGMFEEAFTRMCLALMPTSDCASFARSHEGVQNPVTRSSPEQTKSICSDRTKSVPQFRFRPEFQEAPSAFTSAMNQLTNLF